MITKSLGLTLILAIVFITLGYFDSASAAPKSCEDRPRPSCDGGGGGSEEPPIAPCGAYPCIASVGKCHGRAASDYVEITGTYAEGVPEPNGPAMANQHALLVQELEWLLNSDECD